MIEPGRAMAYVALFSEIGFIYLVTTLVGVGVGYWIDSRLGTLPAFAVVGLLVGFAVGARGMWILVKRFLAQMDQQPPDKRR
ncbi:MAG TPA: AtpZ/AtpI family protein [Candidatus Polarisedimenticolia bacterium]|nr:AtpZ/AtpI family protein [Candidatus Polarisedimenticolia bacterium]